MHWLDRLAAGMLAPLAVWVLLSGLDDLFLDLCAIWFSMARRRRGRLAPVPGDESVPAPPLALPSLPPSPLAGTLPSLLSGLPTSPRPSALPSPPPDPLPEKRIALLIPAWREDAVIERMLDHNLAAIRYSSYEVFVGVYPNDHATLGRVMACEKKHPRLHLVVCPRDGPTYKADCLNWVYQGVLAHEEKSGSRFDIVLHHDAEDLIHPRSLQWINRYAERYDMVQVPVLPLPTPWWEFTHGVYCEEFSRSHLRELQVRTALGGFLPSCGVGTAYRRAALDRLAWNNGDQLFHPDTLTEDYRIGLDLHRLGCSQILLDARLLGDAGSLGATREYFPRQFSKAVRQRARWIAGIALQTWQQIGWDGGKGQLYWLWRDRKGLLGNPLTILANLLFLYGLGRWLWARATGGSWVPAQVLVLNRFVWWVLALNTGLILVHLLSRARLVGVVYGWRQALVSPLRFVWGNWINFAATVKAVGLFAGARVRKRALPWAKTDHSYPTSGVRLHEPRLGELLIELRLLPAVRVEQALGSLEPGERLGEHLIHQGCLSEFQLYTALGIQRRLPFEPLEFVAEEALARLPARFARAFQLIPVRIANGKDLWLAGPELPTEELARKVSRISRLHPRFQLITPSNYRRVCERLEAAGQA